MDDAKIIELYWARNEGAVSATMEKYGRYCAAIAKTGYDHVRIIA